MNSSKHLELQGGQSTSLSSSWSAYEELSTNTQYKHSKISKYPQRKSGGCKGNGIECNIGGGNLHGSTNGFVQEGKEYLVCKLTKTLYKPKQLSKVWYHCIDLFLINEDFCRNQADHSLYVEQHMNICW